MYIVPKALQWKFLKAVVKSDTKMKVLIDTYEVLS